MNSTTRNRVVPHFDSGSLTQSTILLRSFIISIFALNTAGCAAVYDHNMENGKQSCRKIDDFVKRNQCLKYYSKTYEQYEEDVRKLRDNQVEKTL
jgi:hypothetical protein